MLQELAKKNNPTLFGAWQCAVAAKTCKCFLYSIKDSLFKNLLTSYLPHFGAFSNISLLHSCSHGNTVHDVISICFIVFYNNSRFPVNVFVIRYSMYMNSLILKSILLLLFKALQKSPFKIKWFVETLLDNVSWSYCPRLLCRLSKKKEKIRRRRTECAFMIKSQRFSVFFF